MSLFRCRSSVRDVSGSGDIGVLGWAGSLEGGDFLQRFVWRGLDFEAVFHFRWGIS